MMKTYDVAKALSQLSRILNNGENVELQSLNELGSKKSIANRDAIPVALSTLVALAQFDKTQWLEIIRAYDFPVEIRPRDASRDILGKILKHLEESPEARIKLAHQATTGKSATSPELLRALQILLKK